MSSPRAHHAGPDRAGGFCFLKQLGVGGNGCCASTSARVAILDVDLHHGNGTQDIFYYRGDVWTGSLHVDPSDFYPSSGGGANEEGMGEGLGAKRQPAAAVGMRRGAFLEALEILIARLEAFRPEAGGRGAGARCAS